jgi:hypothetical protein
MLAFETAREAQKWYGNEIIILMHQFTLNSGKTDIHGKLKSTLRAYHISSLPKASHVAVGMKSSKHF